MGKAKVTISDVARAAGVSSSAVSYALNDKPGVSSETREKVLRVAETMGWKPNSAAKALSDASTRSIGLVLSMNPEVFAVESYAMALIAGLGTELEKRDYSLRCASCRTQAALCASIAIGLLPAAWTPPWSPMWKSAILESSCIRNIPNRRCW